MTLVQAAEQRPKVQIGYDRRISVEAGSQDIAADGARSIALLRRAFER